MSTRPLLRELHFMKQESEGSDMNLNKATPPPYGCTARMVFPGHC